VGRLELTIDGSDFSGANDASVLLEECADGGEIGMGGFDLDDGVLLEVPALKDATVEDSRTTEPRLWTGMTGPRGLARGTERRAAARKWDVHLWDVNALLEGVILTGSGANRPSESDYARVTWLLTQLAGLGITAGVVPNTNTVTMDAVDYRGEGPRRLLSDCGEMAQKNYFLYLYDPDDGVLLYYDKATGTSLSSSVKLSSVLSDVDGTTVLALQQGAAVELDPSDIYSGVRFKYQGGVIYLEDSDVGLTTSSDYRERWAAVEDSTVKSSARATAKATKYLTAASTERKRFTCSVEVSAEQANDIRGGQRIQIKAPHLATDALDTSGYLWFRITRRQLKLAETQFGNSRERYLLTLEFADDVKLTSFHDSRPPDSGADDTATTDGSAVSLDPWLGTEEIGSPYYGPFAGLWYRIDPVAFAMGHVSFPSTISVHKQPEDNIPWPYTDCGLGTGGVAGLFYREAWFRSQIDLSDESIVGVRFHVDPFTSPVRAAVGDGTFNVGVHTGSSSSAAEVTAHGTYTVVGQVGDGGGDVFVPRSLLIDDGTGYCWFVVAAAWDLSNGFLVCPGGTLPGGSAELGTGGSPDVSATLVTLTGSGLSPWVSGEGDVDGSNTDFVLPLWNGTGTPQVRVGGAELAAGEFSADASTLTVTLVVPPPADMAGQVAFRFRTG